MPYRPLQGTIGLLQNIIQQERQRKAQQQDPRYQMALQNLMMKYEDSLRKKTLTQALGQTTDPDKIASIAMQLGQWTPYVTQQKTQTQLDAEQRKFGKGGYAEQEFAREQAGKEKLLGMKLRGEKELEGIKASQKETELKPVTAPMVEKISKNEDAYVSLGAAVNDLVSNKDRFAQYMGPAKGILRAPVRAYADENFRDFQAWKANVQDAFQQYRVAVTGAQASDREIKMLAKNRPTENDTYDTFIKKANEVRKVGNRVLHRYLQNARRAKFDTSGYEAVIEKLDQDMQVLTSQSAVTKQAPQQVSAPTETQGFSETELDAYSGYLRK